MEIIGYLFIAMMLVMAFVGIAAREFFVLYPWFLLILAFNSVVVIVFWMGTAVAVDRGAHVVRSLTKVATWVLVAWSWGIDGVFLLLSGSSLQQMGPRWVFPGGINWSTHVLQDVSWLERMGVTLPLIPWHRQPLMHYGSMWSVNTIDRMGGLWLRYDTSLLVVALAWSAFWLGMIWLETRLRGKPATAEVKPAVGVINLRRWRRDRQHLGAEERR